MNHNKIKDLEDLKVDDYIWYIYIFIIFAALFSNSLEREYILTNNKKSENAFHSINIIVLTIAFFIYMYFVLKSSNNFKKNKNLDSTLGLISSILFLVAGGILLWLELMSTASKDEIGL